MTDYIINYYNNSNINDVNNTQPIIRRIRGQNIRRILYRNKLNELEKKIFDEYYKIHQINSNLRDNIRIVS